MPKHVLTRREFVAATAAAVTAGAAVSSAAEEPESPGHVDAHSHIWTRDVRRYPLAKGKTVDDLDPASFTAEELLETAKPHGVTRVVLIGHHPYYGWDNSYLIAAAKQRPDTFRVVAMIDDRGDAPGETLRKLRKQHVTGVRITPSIHGRDKWLDGPGMASLWKTAADTRQAICCLVNPEDLPAVDGTCRRFPDTPVVIDHFARIGIDGTIREADLKRLCDLAAHRHVHLKVSAFYALGEKEPPYHDLIPMIRRVYEAFGPDRLMWGSDSPYQLVGEHTYAASVDLVKTGLDFLTASDRARLLRTTAETVYAFG